MPSAQEHDSCKGSVNMHTSTRMCTCPAGCGGGGAADSLASLEHGLEQGRGRVLALRADEATVNMQHKPKSEWRMQRVTSFMSVHLSSILSFCLLL